MDSSQNDMPSLCPLENYGGHQPPSPSKSRRMLLQIHQRPLGIYLHWSISTGLSTLVYLHWSISTANPTTNQDASDEALYSRAGSLNRDTGDIKQQGPLGIPGFRERTRRSLWNSSSQTCCWTTSRTNDSENGDATRCGIISKTRWLWVRRRRSLQSSSVHICGRNSCRIHRITETSKTHKRL